MPEGAAPERRGAAIANAYAVVLTTCADRDAARAMARMLVGCQLAACVQMLPIESIYTWQDALEEANEILLLVKIKAADYASVEHAIRTQHTYDTPEIVALPIADGSEDYLDWIARVTTRTADP